MTVNVWGRVKAWKVKEIILDLNHDLTFYCTHSQLWMYNFAKNLKRCYKKVTHGKKFTQMQNKSCRIVLFNSKTGISNHLFPYNSVDWGKNISKQIEILLQRFCCQYPIINCLNQNRITRSRYILQHIRIVSYYDNWMFF